MSLVLIGMYMHENDLTLEDIQKECREKRLEWAHKILEEEEEFKKTDKLNAESKELYNGIIEILDDTKHLKMEESNSIKEFIMRMILTNQENSGVDGTESVEKTVSQIKELLEDKEK
jgi:3-methyladenine DNA glycosylase AlkC